MLHVRPPHWRLYHTFDFPDGRIIRGWEDTPYLFSLLEPFLPDVRGKTVIDIGAWDGYYSFKMEAMGATRVLATDHFCWSGSGWGNKDVFEVMRYAHRSTVEDMDIDPADISPETVGMFDVSLYLGILYHRPDCFQAFKNAASVAKEWLVVETLLNGTISNDKPLLSFHPFDDIGHDPTNWFIPNISAVEAMFAACGFETPTTMVHDSAIKDYPRGIFVAKRNAPI